jgi:hypothetical protein
MIVGIVQDIAAGIERQEGMNCRNNNPGALRSWGSLPTSGGFAVFPSCDAGRQALQQQVQINIDRGLTLDEFFAGKPGVYGGYAPAADSNQPNVYAAHVSQWSGIPADVPLNTLDTYYSSGPIDEFPGEEPPPDNTVAVLALLVTVAIGAYLLA